MRRRTAIAAGQAAALALLVMLGAALLRTEDTGTVDQREMLNRDINIEPRDWGENPPWSTEQVIAPRPDNSMLWQRENTYILWDNRNRHPQGEIPDKDQHPRAANPNPNRIKVLAIGDSYTWGHGAYDLDFRWPVELQAELDARTAPGAFEITTASMPGTGPAAWLDWFADGRLNASDYDIIILSIVWNDAVIIGVERTFCTEEEERAGRCPDFFLEMTDVYERCMTGRDGITGRLNRLLAGLAPETAGRLRDRRCDYESIKRRTGLVSLADAAAEPHLTLYWDGYLEALKNLESITRPAEVFAFHAVVNPYEMYISQPIREAMKDAGFRFIEPEATAEMIERGGVEGMLANPGSGHPGPVFMRLYALDAADEVMRLTSREALVRAVGTAESVTQPLLSNSMPASLEVENSETFVRIAHRAGSAGHEHDISGRKLPAQRVPCASLGRPHLSLMLTRSLPQGSEVTVRNMSEHELHMTPVGYGPQGTPSRGEGTILGPGGETAVPMGGDSRRGLLVAVDGHE